MKKSYSSPNVMFQPLDIANTFSAGDCLLISDSKDKYSPATPGDSLLEEGWPTDMVVFVSGACNTQPDGLDICYTASTNTVFNS